MAGRERAAEHYREGDSDGDGIEDHLDPDNDNDGICDEAFAVDGVCCRPIIYRGIRGKLTIVMGMGRVMTPMPVSPL